MRLLQLERWIGELERDEIVNSKQKKKLEIYKKQKDDLYAMRQTVYDLEKDTSKPFFLWHIFFADVFNQNNSEERGFDIVIGNPPYIQLQKDGGRLANLFEGLGFETFERTGDIYSLFYEKGVYLVTHLHELHWPTALIGVFSLAILIIFKRIN